MFDNIGGKIKKLAKIVCWVGIVFSVIYAIVLWVIGGVTGQDTTLTGFLVLILGGFGSWIGSFFTYGFGELIDRVKSIDEKMQSTPAKFRPTKIAKIVDDENLKRWLEDGLITEEEYQNSLYSEEDYKKLKARILGV